MRTARLGAILLAVLTLGCGESESPAPSIVDDEPSAAPEAQSEVSPSDEAVPSEAEAPPAETETEAEPDAPPLPEARADAIHVFVLGDDGDLAIYGEDQALESEVIERALGEEVTVRFPRLTHPDARLGSLINERVEAFAMLDAGGEGGLEVSVRCNASLATPTLVSVYCGKTIYDDRDFADEQAPRALHLAVDATGVRPIELASLFVPDADIPGRLRERCIEEADHAAVCSDARMPPGITLDEDGVNAFYAAFEPVEVEIPYTDLAEQIRATGPLAESFERHNVTTRTIQVSAPAVPTPSGPPRWVASPMMSADDLAAAWASLPAEERAAVRAMGSHLVAPDEAVASRVAARLGHRASQVPVAEDALALTLVRFARDSDLLSSPARDAEVTRRLSRGVVGVALAPLDEQTARFPRVVVHRGLVGFVDVRRLSSEEVCTPDLDPFLAGFPEGERGARRVTTLRSALSSGSWGRADFISAEGGTTTIEMRRLEAGCQVDRALVRFTQPGPVTRLDTTRTERRGGETLVVSVGPERVAVHTYGQSEPVWQRDLGAGDEVRVGQRNEDRWLPIVIAHAGRDPVEVEWANDALTVAGP